jgi:hypothetical protein
MAEGGIGIGLGAVSAVLQTYGAVASAYDVYLDLKEFPTAYQELRVGLLIERYRLELWANQVLSEEEQEQAKLSRKYWPLWELLNLIFHKMLEAFRTGDHTMEKYGQRMGSSNIVESSGNGFCLGLWAGVRTNLTVLQMGTCHRACH